VLVAACLALYLPGQRTLPVTDRDEARFMQATRQMVASGDFIVVRFQDELRAKKPAGIYWLQAAFVAGLSSATSTEAWPYRMPSLIAAITIVLLTFALARKLFDDRVAWIAATTLATSLLLGVEAHLASTDATLAALTVLAQGLLGLTYVNARKRLSSAAAISVGFWLALGAAILVKGPIAPMIAGLTIAALSIADKDAHWIRTLRPGIGILLLMLVVAPWFAAVTLRTHGAFVSRAIQEDLLPKLVGGHEGHGAPPGYYAVVLTLSLWPGSFFLWPALGWAKRAFTEPAIRFLVAWTIPAWIAFELIPTKLPHYTLPLHAAFAMLIGCMIAAALQTRRTASRLMHGWFLLWSICSFGLAALVVWLPRRFGSGVSMQSMLTAAGVLICIACAWLFIKHVHRTKALIVAAVSGAVTQVGLIAGILPGLSALWISQRTAAAISQAAPSAHVLAVGYREPSLVFLLGTQTRLTDAHSAAEQLMRDPNSLAIVAENNLPAFTRAAAAGRISERATIDGFNYSRGKEVHLYLFMANDPVITR
jgi:4-amino-4-deoxy-L-arabinose transferase-like glycosyltransferase